MAMAGEHELNRDVDVDLGGIFASIWRNKIKLLLISLIVTVLAFFVLQMISPRYSSEARILIRAGDPVLASPGTQTRPVQNDLDDPGIASQVQLLRSRTIARKVIEKLKLKERPEFDPELKPSPLRNMLALIGLADDNRGVTAGDRVLETYFKRLQVFQAERARVVVVKFWSNDPKLAAAVPNMIAQEYLDLQEVLKRGAAPEELKKLEPELNTLRRRVMEAEAAVAEFRETSDLLQGANNDTLATQELSELSTELGRVRAQLSRAEANAAAVRSALESGSLDTASSVLQSPLIQRLRERQVTLNAQLSELSTTLLSGHPRVQRLQSQISTLSNQINAEARKIQASLQQEARVARAREQDLIQRRNTLKSESGRVGRAQVKLRSLEREADAQRQLLNAYLVRFKEAKSRQNREFLPADAFVFSKAQVQSKPYFPKKLPILAGTFFGTFLLGAMVTLTGSILSGNAARQSYLDNYSAMRAKEPPLVSTSLSAKADAKAAASAVLAEGLSPPIVPSMKTLTTPSPDDPSTVSAKAAAKSIGMLGKARIAMIAPEGDDSAWATVVFARQLAGQGANVIVLDMTGSASSSRAMLGAAKAAGIKDLMAGDIGFAEAIHSDQASSAHIMPSGNADASTAANSADRLSTIVEALQQTYDYLVIDCGSADVNGVTRISTASTINILCATNPADPTIAAASDMLVKNGFRAPLVLHVSDDERRASGLEPA